MSMIWFSAINLLDIDIDIDISIILSVLRFEINCSFVHAHLDGFPIACVKQFYKNRLIAKSKYANYVVESIKRTSHVTAHYSIFSHFTLLSLCGDVLSRLWLKHRNSVASIYFKCLEFACDFRPSAIGYF